MGPPKSQSKKIKNNNITKRAEFLKIGENIKTLKWGSAQLYGQVLKGETKGFPRSEGQPNVESETHFRKKGGQEGRK